jgi:Tfp pilus assembly protein PilO
MLFRERQQIAICATAAAMICGFVLFRYLPLQRRMNSLRQARAEQMLVISKALTANQQMPAVREQLQHMRIASEKYERQIPAQRELGEFMQNVAKLMNDLDLKGQMIQPGKEIHTGELKCIPVNMQCKGKLSQIFEFYRCLQKLDRLVRIERVKLVNDSGFGGEITMQTDVVIYYRAETEQG